KALLFLNNKIDETNVNNFDYEEHREDANTENNFENESTEALNLISDISVSEQPQNDISHVLLETSDTDFYKLTSNLNNNIKVEFPQLLAQWAIEENISLSSLGRLLSLLKDCGKKIDVDKLPKDPRTLLKTPVVTNIKQLGSGCYYYFGIANSINVLLKRYNLKINDIHDLDVAINIDGLPLTKSTNNSFWD
ncbi:hypothetical protein ILUMI_14618, partial [Ignelater luminosus]